MARRNDEGLCPVCGNCLEEDGYCIQCGYSEDGNSWMNWNPGQDD